MNRRSRQVMGVVLGLLLLCSGVGGAQEAGDELETFRWCLKPFDDVLVIRQINDSDIAVEWQGLDLYTLQGAGRSVYDEERDLYFAQVAVLNSDPRFFGSHRLGTLLTFTDGTGEGFWRAEFSSHPIVRSVPFITGGTVTRCPLVDEEAVASTVQEFRAMTGVAPSLAGTESR